MIRAIFILCLIKNGTIKFLRMWMNQKPIIKLKVMFCKESILKTVSGIDYLIFIDHYRLCINPYHNMPQLYTSFMCNPFCSSRYTYNTDFHFWFQNLYHLFFQQLVLLFHRCNQQLFIFLDFQPGFCNHYCFTWRTTACC